MPEDDQQLLYNFISMLNDLHEQIWLQQGYLQLQTLSSAARHMR